MRSSGHDVKDTLSAKTWLHWVPSRLPQPAKRPVNRGFFVSGHPVESVDIRAVAAQQAIGPPKRPKKILDAPPVSD